MLNKWNTFVGTYGRIQEQFAIYTLGEKQCN